MTIKHALVLGVLALVGCARVHETPSNVVLITIDTLRADRLGIYGGGVPTPNLDALARDGVFFRNAFAQSPLTLPSHSSILTGMLPTRHGVRDNGRYRLPDEIETLAEMLKGAGFRTAAFVGAFPVHSRFRLDQGFDLYDDALEEPAARAALAERRGADVVSRAVQWLTETASERTFTWVHLFDPHAPYAPPSPFPPSYEGEVAYVDRVLEELLRAREDTLVIVTSDHGEGLGEHGEATHSLFVYDSTLRVPLILHGPGVRPGLEVSTQVRSIDVVPTVLELLGLAGLCSSCDGESLVPLFDVSVSPSLPSYAETYFPRLNLGWSELRSLRADGWKYVDAPDPELYHVEFDAGETRNLIDDNPGKASELRERLEAFQAAGEPSGAPELDDETLAALRSLGYVSARRAPEPASRPDPKSRLATWESIRTGMDFFARGEFQDAIAELEPVTGEEPDLVLARTHLAAAYFETGRYRDAARESTAVLAREAKDFDATLLLGKALARIGHEDDSRKVLRRAAELDQKSGAPWVELSQLSLRRSKEEAEGFLAEAKKREPGAGGVLLMEGKLAMLSGDAAGAESYFRKALDAAPYQDEPRVQLGNVLLGQRRLDEARALFEEGLRARPETAAFHLGLGHSLALAGDLERAVPALEKALALEPSSTLVLNSLGYAYLELGRTNEGVALLRRSLQIAPDQPELKSFFEKK